ncbi:MAG: ParB/RepB/Spo0J family partition protein [Bacteroidota bacterium]
MSNKKRVLGRGLDALLDSREDEVISLDADGNSMVWSHANIPVNRIVTNPYQPRNDFEAEALNELAISLKEQGFIQPITVRKLGHDKFQLISGERRYRAAQIAGLTMVPAYIRTADDNQMLELALVENIQRRDLNGIEIAISLQRMIDELNYTQENLGDKIGKGRTTITNYLRLLKLPAEIQVAVRDGKISMGHARAIINLPDEKTQLAFLYEILSNNLNVREVENLARTKQQETKPAKTLKPKELPSHYQSTQKSLEAKLSAKVELKRDSKGKGSLRILFKNDSELDKLLETLL